MDEAQQRLLPPITATQKVSVDLQFNLCKQRGARNLVYDSNAKAVGAIQGGELHRIERNEPIFQLATGGWGYFA